MTGPPSLGRMLSGSLFRWLRRLLIPILAVVVILGLLYFMTTGVTLPEDGDPIPVSNEEAIGFIEKVVDAVGDAPGTRAVSITVTDTEVTSFLVIATRLRGQLEEGGGTGDLADLPAYEGDEPALPGLGSLDEWRDLIESEGGLGEVLDKGVELRFTLREPEVRFTEEGAVIVRGRGKLAFISVPARVVLVPNVVDGELDFEFVEGQLGRLPLPAGVANLVADGLEQAIAAGHSIAAVTDLDVQLGSLTFAGSVTR